MKFMLSTKAKSTYTTPQYVTKEKEIVMCSNEIKYFCEKFHKNI